MADGAAFREFGTRAIQMVADGFVLYFYRESLEQAVGDEEKYPPA